MASRPMVEAMDKRDMQAVLARVWPEWAAANLGQQVTSGAAHQHMLGKTIGIVEALAAVLGIQWIEADVALRTYQPKES